jgi:hypothetical protein
VLKKTMIALLALFVVVAAAWLWTPDLKRADLEARYSRGPGDFIEVAGLRLHVQDTGPRDAPVVILLHGFGGSLQTWDDWTRLFQPGLRVVTLDLPGAGLTGADPTGDYSDARGQVVLLALMELVLLDQVLVVLVVAQEPQEHMAQQELMDLMVQPVFQDHEATPLKATQSSITLTIHT